MKYYLVTLEWTTGFVSRSVVLGNRLEGELKFAKSLNYVNNVTTNEIEQHEYEGFLSGTFKFNQGPSSDSERTSTEPKELEKIEELPKKPKVPKLASLEDFFKTPDKPIRKRKNASK
jgi:hypothetical protein